MLVLVHDWLISQWELIPVDKQPESGREPHYLYASHTPCCLADCST